MKNINNNESAQTQGSKKINNYFLELIKSDSFRKMILEMRRKYKIPGKGFKFNEKQYESLGIPKEWKLKTKSRDIAYQMSDNLINDLKYLQDNYKIIKK